MSGSVQRWLRDDPTFAAMNADAVKAAQLWPGVVAVAHRDPATGRVTFHLHVRGAARTRLFDLLGPVDVDQTGPATYHFQGGRRDMDRLLKGLSS